MLNGTTGRRTWAQQSVSPYNLYWLLTSGWFCLSNPKVTKHLIVGIGSETYVTLPKGQLIPTHRGGNPLVPGGGHVLVSRLHEFSN